jgi:flagellar biosynthesis/type III secretory pathway M-ring protein FliF/YscJ
MSNFWLKTKIWTKLILVLQGAENVVTSTFQLVLIAFFSGILVAILFRTAIRTVSQMRELKTREAAAQRDREIEELKAKAGMLRTRKDDISEDPEPRVE